MNKLGKYTLYISCLILLTSAKGTRTGTIDFNTIPPYIDHILGQLMGLNVQCDLRAKNDFNAIKDQAKKASLKPTRVERWFNIPVQRTSDQIQENIFSSIIDFVEKRSYNYAYQKTHNTRTSQEVANKIRDSITKQIIGTAEFEPGALALFIGNDLCKKVDEECKLLGCIDI